jgi:hypothetical protein
MSNSFMSPLPPFTLESLVTNGQWTAAQNSVRKKDDAKPGSPKKAQQTGAAQNNKAAKPSL